MYIIELFMQWLNKNKRGQGANPQGIYEPDYDIPKDEAVRCKHKFMPVDSTGQVLACIKCGFVIRHKNYKG